MYRVKKPLTVTFSQNCRKKSVSQLALLLRVEPAAKESCGGGSKRAENVSDVVQKMQSNTNQTYFPDRR